MLVALDRSILGLTFFVLLLMVTGGVRGQGFELAQINVFGVLLLLLLFLRRKLTGSSLPEALEARLKRVLTVKPARAVFLCALVFYLVHFTIQVLSYAALNTNAYDLGFVDQPIWATAYLREAFHSSLSQGGHAFGEHFIPLTALFAPLYKLWPSPHWLFAAQALMTAATAGLVYALARSRGVGRGGAALLGVAALLYQPLRAAATFTFREDLFFLPLFLGALLALERKRMAPFWACAAASWLVKENAPLVTGMLAVVLLRRKKPAHAVALAVLSVAVFWVVNTKVIPHFSQSVGGGVMVRRLPLLGTTVPEILSHLLFHPLDSALKILGPVIEWKTARYLFLVLLPFALFPARSFAYGIAAVLLLMNVLISPRSVGFHYECIAIPFLFRGLIEGYRQRVRRDGVVESGVILVAALLAVFGRSPILTLRENWPSAERRCVARMLSAVPPDVSIATHNALYVRLSHRRDAFLRGQAEAFREDYIVVGTLPGLDFYATPQLPQVLDHLAQARPDYRVLFEGHGLKVWCKASVCGGTNSLAFASRLRTIGDACATR